MTERERSGHIRARLEGHGLRLPAKQLAAAELYIGLLTKWQRTVNLTGLALAPLADEAIDRLLAEPLLAARFLPDRPGLLIDVGSGSGSPAIPLKIARPAISLAMVESRARKSAFLREAVRHLELDRTDVITARLGEAGPGFLAAASWASIRAVRTDSELWQSISTLMKPDGRILWFRAQTTIQGAGDDSFRRHFGLEAVHPLIAAQQSELAILRSEG